MMMPDVTAKLRRSLVLHEGLKRFPYTDTVGKITIGIGYNLTDRGLDEDWINLQYEKDVSFFYNKLTDDFPWFLKLNHDRQIALIDMAFMGYRNFLTFKKMLAALENNDFKTAAFEMINSKWAEQTKGRAAQLANVILTGVYDI